MKKTIIFSAVCALLAAGCTKQKTDDWKPGTVQFTITAGADTRAGIYSEEEIVPVIPGVDIYVFQNDLFVKTINIPAFTSGMILTLEEDNVLPAGEYRFLAVGRLADDAYALPTDWTGLAFDEAIATLVAANIAGDIYAGNATETLTDQGGRVTIDMTRKAAGILGYFSNIPAVIDGKQVGYLRLTMSNTNTAVGLTDGAGSVPTGAGFDIIEFDFTSEEHVNGVYPGIDLTGQGVVTVPGSYLDGSFVIPVTATFTLGLYDANTSNTVPLKEWTINGGADIQIEANNLYKIGRKHQAGNIDGGTSADDTDDDYAFDLMNSQELTITVSPGWNDVIDLL